MAEFKLIGYYYDGKKLMNKEEFLENKKNGTLGQNKIQFVPMTRLIELGLVDQNGKRISDKPTNKINEKENETYYENSKKEFNTSIEEIKKDLNKLSNSLNNHKNNINLDKEDIINSPKEEKQEKQENSEDKFYRLLNEFSKDTQELIQENKKHDDARKDLTVNKENTETKKQKIFANMLEKSKKGQKVKSFIKKHKVTSSVIALGMASFIVIGGILIATSKKDNKDIDYNDTSISIEESNALLNIVDDNKIYINKDKDLYALDIKNIAIELLKYRDNEETFYKAFAKVYADDSFYPYSFNQYKNFDRLCSETGFSLDNFILWYNNQSKDFKIDSNNKNQALNILYILGKNYENTLESQSNQRSQ